MPRAFRPCVLTANDLLEGCVVYFALDGTWTRRLAQAHLFVDEAEANHCLAEAERCEEVVIDPYLADADSAGRSGPQPVHFRETFRATGPSNYDHGKQEGS